MPRQKTEKTAKVRYAILISGKHKKEVKAWQYYTIFGFCRDHGEMSQNANNIALWCRDRAKDGEAFESSGYSIKIEEREVVI